MKGNSLSFAVMLCVAAIHPQAQAQASYILLEAMSSRKCAHVQAAEQADGARISQWECRELKQSDPAPYFQWDKIEVGGGYFMLRARHSNKCVQVNHASKENGAPITQWSCQRDRAHFHWKQEIAETRAGDRYFFIVNRNSGKCMHVHGGGNENGDLITQWECVNQPNVKWMVIVRGRID